MDEDSRTFLGKYTTATLASARSDGSPQVATIFYAVDAPGSVVFKSRSQSDHMTHLLGDGRAALAIYDHASTYAVKSGLQLRGTVERISELDDMTRCVALYSARFEGAGKKFLSPEELVTNEAASTLFRLVILEGKFTDAATDRVDLSYSAWPAA